MSDFEGDPQPIADPVSIGGIEVEACALSILRTSVTDYVITIWKDDARWQGIIRAELVDDGTAQAVFVEVGNEDFTWDHTEHIDE